MSDEHDFFLSIEEYVHNPSYESFLKMDRLMQENRTNVPCLVGVPDGEIRGSGDCNDCPLIEKLSGLEMDCCDCIGFSEPAISEKTYEEHQGEFLWTFARFIEWIKVLEETQEDG